MIRRWVIIFLIGVSGRAGYAQSHYNMWMRTTLGYSIHEKVSVETEFQHRRQNGYENVNMFRKALMYSFRNWWHYQHNPQLKISFSPFAYYQHYPIIREQKDCDEGYRSEIRVSTAAEYRHPLSEKFSLLNRGAAEYRIFEKKPVPVSRARYRLGISYSIHDNVKLIVYDELLVNLSGVKTGHLLDHNRSGFQVEYEIFQGFRLDIGYIHINRLPLTGKPLLRENNLVVNIGYKINR